MFNVSQYRLLKEMPKYNAHCHLGGEIPMETIEKFANPEQVVALKNGIAEIVAGKEYEKCFFIFPLISQVINTLDKLKEAAYQTCQRFKEDNNQLVLMRTGLKSFDHNGYEGYLKAVLEGFEKAASRDFSIRLLLSLKRSSSFEMAKLTVDLALKYRKEGVIGIDISDASNVGDINTIMPELLRAKESGLKIAVHMGEVAEEKDQMVIIDKLQPDLIDHGVNLCDEAKAWVEQNNISVTVCPTSSKITRMHDPEGTHPWITHHLQSSHPIDFGTDDSTIFGGITLSDEFARLCYDGEIDRVVKIATASFERGKIMFGSN